MKVWLLARDFIHRNIMKRYYSCKLCRFIIIVVDDMEQHIFRAAGE